MSSILQTLRKPYEYAFSLYPSRTHQGVSPSLTAEKASFLSSILSPFETYVVSLQSLLIWEKPYLSAGAFVTLNILYWLVVSWNRRFFSILSIFALASFLYKTWVNQIWPEIRVPPEEGEDTESWCTLNPGVLSVPELCKYLNDFLDKMIILWKDVWKLRKESHGLFCALMCGFFSLTGLIGIIFPGVLIIYFFVLLLTLGPGVALHLIPSTVYDQIIGYFSETDSQVSAASKSPCISDKDSDLEEFFPEISPEVIRQLSLKDDVPEIPSPGVVLTESSDLPGDASFITESDDFSLYQGLGAFPSVEEEGESDIEEDVLDIMPQAESEKIEIHFNPSHFKDSSESESEAAFTEGLSFSETQEQKPLVDQPCTKETAQENSSKKKETRKLSSDLEDELEDFELLDDSDFPSLK